MSAAHVRLEGRQQCLIHYQIVWRRHASSANANSGPGTLSSSRHFHFHHDSPKGGSSAPRGRLGTNFRGCKARTRIQFGSGVRTASRRTVAGTFRRGFSEICTALTRWGSPMQLVPYSAPPPRPLGLIGATPAFSAPARVGGPPVASSLLPKVIGDKKLISSGPAFPLRFRLVIKKRSLRERIDVGVLLMVLSTVFREISHDSNYNNIANGLRTLSEGQTAWASRSNVCVKWRGRN